MNGPLSMNRKTYYDIYARNEFFAVDDFNDGTCVRHNFLTRFHPNQYTGLTEKFPRYIYASKITGLWIVCVTIIVINRLIIVNCSLFDSQIHQCGRFYVADIESGCANYRWRSRNYGHRCAKVMTECTWNNSKLNRHSYRTLSSYPGALMLVFKDQNGRVEMHGGYMHTSAELEETSTTWNHMEIDSLILHKTPRWEFSIRSVALDSDLIYVSISF